MAKGGSTRSGLLWEVERLLTEVDELPQILLMENVPQVVADKNISDFANWVSFLDSLGYHSKYKILNAKNFGIPQNRERCFMLSWLGGYYYEFPKPMKLKTKFRMLLEDEVDEKYYLSDRIINTFTRRNGEAIQKGNGFRFEIVEIDALERERERVAAAITTHAGSRMDDNYLFIPRHRMHKSGGSV